MHEILRTNFLFFFSQQVGHVQYMTYTLNIQYHMYNCYHQ